MTRRSSTAGRPHHRTRTDAAYARLRDSIVTLRLAPGAKTDRGRPVRAARHLAHASARGAAPTSAGRPRRRERRQTRRDGVSVAPLTAEDMRELFLMVGALDGVAARLAAELPVEQRRAVVTEASAINAKLRSLPAENAADIRTAQELDLQFHHAYERAASGPRLLAKLAALHARRERYVRVYTEALIHSHRVQESLDEHGAILQAIEAGDPEAAERSGGLQLSERPGAISTTCLRSRRARQLGVTVGGWRWALGVGLRGDEPSWTSSRTRSRRPWGCSVNSICRAG